MNWQRPALLSSAVSLYKYDIFQAAVTFKSQALDLLAETFFLLNFFFVALHTWDKLWCGGGSPLLSTFSADCIYF